MVTIFIMRPRSRGKVFGWRLEAVLRIKLDGQHSISKDQPPVLSMGFALLRRYRAGAGDQGFIPKLAG